MPLPAASGLKTFSKNPTIADVLTMTRKLATMKNSGERVANER